MKSVFEKHLGPQYVVETENKSSFTNQIDSRLLSEKVWFFFNFPHFFLQSLIKKLIPSNPCVLVDDGKGEPLVLQMNNSAKALGVRKDMPLALVERLGGITILERNKGIEKKETDSLLLWAGKFSPLVVDKFPDGLLVEVKGSLKLFGGQKKLIKMMSDDLDDWGYKFALATGATPLLAEIGAKKRRKEAVSNRFTSKEINTVPVSMFSFLPKQLELLKKMGVRTLGDYKKLPRKGLAERFGKDALQQFDRLYGYEPDPQRFYIVPQKENISITLDCEVEGWLDLKPYIKELLKKANKYLSCKALKARQLTWFFCRYSSEVKVPIFLSGTNNISVVLRILEEKLKNKRFREPFDSIRLSLDEVENARQENLNIFHKANKTDTNLLCDQFVDLIRSRYGEESLYVLNRKPEHVPEHSFAYCYSFDGKQNATCLPGNVLPKIKRPVWFIDPPMRLVVKKNKPFYDGRPLILSGRERIVSDWWTGAEIARDYFVAESYSGMILWIYRELVSKENWFFQGLFE